MKWTRDMTEKAFLFASLIFLVIFSILAVGGTVTADEGGTDGDIEIYGDGGGGFNWNEIHCLVMIESDSKIDQSFNVTVCEDVTYNGGNNTYSASGHVFGELSEIRWDDEPEPSIEITMEDFDTYKEDHINLTVYILGEYYRNGPGGDELRQAYTEILVQRPNYAPKSIAMITNSDENENGMWDNWTTVEDNEHGEITYYIDIEGGHTKLWLNASTSTDQDDDDVTEFNWDLDGDGRYGAENSERKMNTSRYLGEGDHTLGLIVSDGDKYSVPLYIRIVIRQPIRYPDLAVQNIQVVNKNGNSDIFKGDRCAVIAEVKNIGDKESTDPFDVHFQYWYHDESPSEPYWEDLGTERFTETINVNGLKLIEMQWDTGIPEFYPGIYSFRAIVDYSQEMKELRERNNYFPLEGEEMFAENITLEEDGGCCEPDIILVETTISKTEARVNEIVWINITLRNDGDGEARYVDIYYYIDNTFQYYKTIERLDKNGAEWIESFIFSGDSSNTFKIMLEVKDDGIIIETSDVFLIQIAGSAPTARIKSITPNPAMEGASVTFDAGGSDGGTIVQYQWSTAGLGILYKGSKQVITDNSLPAGNHTISLKVQNAGGSWSHITSAFLTIIPNTHPEISIISPKNNSILSGVITIEGTASDEDGDVEMIEVYISGDFVGNVTGINSWKFEWDTGNIKNGDYVITVRAFDGLHYSEYVSITVKVENENGGGSIPVLETVYIIFAVGVALITHRRRSVTSD